MKRLLILLLAALALPTAVEANWFGKYKSKVEAWEACDKWSEDYEIYWSPDYDIANKRYSKLLREYEKANDYVYKKQAKFNLDSVKKATIAFCRGEEETRQILGYGIKGLKKDLIYERSDYLGLRNYKILKYFKY